MPSSSQLFADDTECVRTAIQELDGGTLLASLKAELGHALAGSDDATRRYVGAFRMLAERVLDEAQRTRPDIVVRTREGRLAIVDVKGTARRAPVAALETASAEAPFGPWTGRFPLEEAIALDLTSRVRQLIGLHALEPPSRAAGLGALAVDDATAWRFLCRVRFHLNHPEDENPLHRLMEAFGLTKTELAGLFGIRRQAVDQWLERGVPGDRQEKLTTLLAVADLLERKLKPGRLPGVARRPSDAYGGKTMLELIADNRHRDLLEQVRGSFDWASAA